MAKERNIVQYRFPALGRAQPDIETSAQGRVLPHIGDRVIGPDDMGDFQVTEIIHYHDDGFYYPATKILVICK